MRRDLPLVFALLFILTGFGVCGIWTLTVFESDVPIHVSEAELLERERLELQAIMKDMYGEDGKKTLPRTEHRKLQKQFDEVRAKYKKIRQAQEK